VTKIKICVIIITILNLYQISFAQNIKIVRGTVYKLLGGSGDDLEVAMSDLSVNGFLELNNTSDKESNKFYNFFYDSMGYCGEEGILDVYVVGNNIIGAKSKIHGIILKETTIPSANQTQIDLIKKSILYFDQTVRIGDALDNYKYIKNSTWISYEDVQKRKFVEFTAIIDKIKLVSERLLTIDRKGVTSAGIAEAEKEAFVSIQFILDADMKNFTIGYCKINDAQGETVSENIIKEMYKNLAFASISRDVDLTLQSTPQAIIKKSSSEEASSSGDCKSLTSNDLEYIQSAFSGIPWGTSYEDIVSKYGVTFDVKHGKHIICHDCDLGSKSAICNVNKGVAKKILGYNGDLAFYFYNKKIEGVVNYVDYKDKCFDEKKFDQEISHLVSFDNIYIESSEEEVTTSYVYKNMVLQYTVGDRETPQSISIYAKDLFEKLHIFALGKRKYDEKNAQKAAAKPANEAGK